MKSLVFSLMLASMLIILSAFAYGADNMVLYLNFEEGQGAAVTDVSGTGNNGVVHGDAIWGAGKYGSAIQFDGVDDYVEITVNDSLTFAQDTSFTLMAWIQTSAVPAENIGIITNYKEQTTPFWNLCVRSTSPGPGYGRFQFRDTAGTIPRCTTPIPVNDGTWHHMAGVRDAAGRTLRLYLDGELVEEAADTTAADINSGQNVFVGIIYAFSFDGVIDEVKVWRSALSEDEVITEMQESSASSVDASDKLAATWGEVKAGL